MGQVLVFTSGKGGVGKTTMAANLAYSLALCHCKVALLDLDIGLRNLDLIMGIEHKVVYHIGDVLDGICQLRQALIRDKRIDNLVFLPGMSQWKNDIDKEALEQLIIRLKKEFDYIIVDGPAGIECGFRIALSVADEAFVVVNPEICSVRDSNQVIEYINSVNVPVRLIVNRVRKSILTRNRFLGTKDIGDMLMLPIYGEIPNDEKIISYINRGEIMSISHNPIGVAINRLGYRVINEKGRELC